MFTYSQTSGMLDHDGALAGTGYSGHAEGRNNPAMQSVHNIGPIPQGLYAIGPPFDTATHGPHVMALTPVGHDALGRSGFLMHGDNVKHDASEGCIIMLRTVRDLVSNSGDKQLTVTG